MRKIKIGLLGCGTVGGATYEILQMNAAKIAQKTGVMLEITRILVRDDKKTYQVPQSLLTLDFQEILQDPEIEIIVELMGGIEPATSYMLQALRAKKHVVTANKAAVAAAYKELIQASSESQVMLRFEASVAGGIPVLDALQAPLNSNDIEEVSGIVNGTTNYILTQMTEKNQTYEQALAQAQEKGFAEADPTADVEGIDSANKLAILTALAFDEILAVAQIPTVGISSLQSRDLAQAEQLGYEVKLIANAKKTASGLQASVQPTLVPKEHMLAAVANEFNGIFIRGNAVGDLMFYGKGAGGLPTASAVAGDIIEIANAIDKQAAFDSYVNKISESKLTYIGEGKNAYYLRLSGDNHAGSLGKITTVLGAHDISIKSLIQTTEMLNGTVILIVGAIDRQQLDLALAEVLKLPEVLRVDSVLRVME